MDAPKRFIRDESGLETVEWAFILGLVVLLAVVALARAGAHLTATFGDMVTELAAAEDFGGP